MSVRATWDMGAGPSLTTRVLTDRLTLRPPRTADVPEMRRALRQNAIHLRPWSVAPAAGENAYLGYWIDAEHQGRGLMTEAVRAATTFALEAAGLHRVQAAVMPRNGASQRVLEKAGYRREGLATRYLCIAGIWEDHVLFATTAEEWALR